MTNPRDPMDREARERLREAGARLRGVDDDTRAQHLAMIHRAVRTRGEDRAPAIGARLRWTSRLAAASMVKVLVGATAAAAATGGLVASPGPARDAVRTAASALGINLSSDTVEPSPTPAPTTESTSEDAAVTAASRPRPRRPWPSTTPGRRCRPHRRPRRRPARPRSTSVAPVASTSSTPTRPHRVRHHDRRVPGLGALAVADGDHDDHRVAEPHRDRDLDRLAQLPRETSTAAESPSPSPSPTSSTTSESLSGKGNPGKGPKPKDTATEEPTASPSPTATATLHGDCLSVARQ